MSPDMNFNAKETRSEHGIAMMLAIFILVLLSILVVDLTYSTYINGRINKAAQNSLKAEFLLKSTVSVARAMIKSEPLPDGSYIWDPFVAGQAVPGDMLGLSDPGISIAMEITPEESKFPIRAVLSGDNSNSVNVKWRDALLRLFQSLGFDDDGELDHTGLFKGQHLKSDELVSLLIDYMDADNSSYSADDFIRGFEDDGRIPEGYFPNLRIKRVGELQNIPGFTPARMRKLQPLLTVFGSERVNVNYASAVVLRSLHIDLGAAEAEALILFRKGTKFTDSNKNTELNNILGESVYQQVLTMLDINSRWYQVLAKIDYGTSSFFARAFLSQNEAKELPIVRSFELF